MATRSTFAPKSENGVAGAVRKILADNSLDYARTKVALDQLVDPSANGDKTLREVDRLTKAAKLLAGPNTATSARLAAIHKLIYESGPWNDGRPFAYDHGDPEGTHIPNKLLHVYLRRRLGNCVSMPILFLIFAERLGVDTALARAPSHIFLRHRMADGRIANIETTSGGHPARDEWFRQNFPMSERALASGLYMRSLSRREGMALMATMVLEHLAEKRRWNEVIAVAEAILAHDPRAADVLVWQGSAYGHLLESEAGARFAVPLLLPVAPLARRLMLMERNNSLIHAAETLGWQPDN